MLQYSITLKNIMDPDPPVPGLADMVDADPEKDGDNNDGQDDIDNEKRR